MQKYCTNCGTAVNDEHKFCPECGARIIISDIEDNNRGSRSNLKDAHSKQIKDLIICDNCGEENFAGSETCSSCGVKITESLTNGVVKEEKITVVNTRKKPSKHTSDHYKAKSGKKKKKTKQSANIKIEQKVFGSKKLYLIAIVIGIFAIIILVSSGVFNSDPKINSNNTTGINQPNESGIDLGGLQRINDLEAALQANPDDTAILLELAHLKNDSGFYDKAIPLYERYLIKIPSDANARIDMGVCYYNLGNFDTAIVEMKKALQFDPKHQIGHLNLGVVNLTAGNVEEAKQWFQKAVDLGPNTDIGIKAKELLNSHNL